MPFNKDGIWRPNVKQEPFLALPDEVFEAFYGGGAGSGKSEVLLVYGIVRGWTTNPKFKQVFLRRTYAELKLEIVKRSQELFLPLGATFNRSDMLWTFKREDQFGSGMTNNGATIKLGHCEYDDDVHNYDSMEINLFTPDEATSLTKFIYQYIAYTRVRSSDPGVLPAIVRAAGMPGNIGHTWVKEKFIKPAPLGGVLIPSPGNQFRIYIHATVRDNQYADQTYINKLQLLDDAEKKAKEHGDWDAYIGTVFNEFRDKHIPGEPDNALHVINPIGIPDWWPKIVVIDWGFRAYTWVGFGAISPSKRLYIYRELAWLKTKISEWGAELKEYIDEDDPRLIRVCKSAGQDRGTDKTIQQQIEDALDRSVELTNNTPGSRVAGKMLLHEYLRWKPKHTSTKDVGEYDDEKARWILRNRGNKEYESYIESFNPNTDNEVLPKLLIQGIDDEGTPCAPLLVEAIKACIYAKDKEGKPAEDVAEFEGDDAYDGIRYMCDAADNYFDDAAEEFKKVQEQAALIVALQQTNDVTAYYRNARRLESSVNELPLMRIHHRRRR